LYEQHQKEKAARDLRSLTRKFDKQESSSSSSFGGDPGFQKSSSNSTSKSKFDKDDDSDSESESEEIPPSHPDYLPYEEMPKRMMEALCGKEREHWKKA
jgi:hypothetical protein